MDGFIMEPSTLEIVDPEFFNPGPLFSSLTEEQLFGIKLPKIKIGSFIGDVVKKVVPGGSVIVAGANTAIDVVKGSKISAKSALRDVGAKAIDAAAAQVKNNLENQTKNEMPVNIAGFNSNTMIVIMVGLVAVILLTRR